MWVRILLCTGKFYMVVELRVRFVSSFFLIFFTRFDLIYVPSIRSDSIESNRIECVVKTVWRVASFGVHTIDMGMCSFCANVRQSERRKASSLRDLLTVENEIPLEFFLPVAGDPFVCFALLSSLFFPGASAWPRFCKYSRHETDIFASRAC